jgi:cation transport ATPase
VLSAKKLGKTVSYIAEDGLGVGFVSISDAIKTSSKKAIATLMSEGVSNYAYGRQRKYSKSGCGCNRFDF